MKLKPQNRPEPPKKTRRPYQKPAVVYESTISTRAGSPINMPDNLNLIDYLLGRS